MIIKDVNHVSADVIAHVAQSVVKIMIIVVNQNAHQNVNLSVETVVIITNVNRVNVIAHAHQNVVKILTIVVNQNVHQNVRVVAGLEDVKDMVDLDTIVYVHQNVEMVVNQNLAAIVKLAVIAVENVS